VNFEGTFSLWGKDIVETTVLIQEQKEDGNVEILCIASAGEDNPLLQTIPIGFHGQGPTAALGSSLEPSV